ncbi:CaiB/BaiF CoA transferase family protein [Sulfitobacter geojensis]|uniref:CoA transferase n=1 Tax=Sulfitobacter geojensis TaxID=1342299 RepID=A0AAE2W1R6_9RHOB|nr:CoA transferase [Sulfitobacter geojensis]MBM1691186.1 CoA transferase [Sulfitobacter geojensis]MBM1695252.1 CoA transferase [Sulfitobacter geojensis]MBM1707352.1 CoA transferase [Sulfitobacter geojensis]MBM1711502.1 CoA transferase [Sulfitobacter geojensis]MBM1715477.1 CoA transferase [Sulfitobacter geojensis]
MTGPLNQLRIVELGHVIAGPLSAALLSDFGADVIKIESPSRTDMMRDLGPKAEDGVGVWWKTLGRNKKILSLNWKSAEGRDILRKLVEGADVLVENFRPGVLERGGVGPNTLHEWNPDLIILRVSGYGQDGPMRDVPAFGRAAEAMSGLAHLTGFTDGPPMHPGFPAADSTTGLMGALGIMLALFAREKGSARGQVVDLAVFESLLRLMDYPVPALTGANHSPRRNGLRQPMDFAPGGMFRTSDGVWLTVSAGSAETAQRLLRAVGGDALADDPRFSTLAEMSSHMTVVFDAINDFVTQRTLSEVEAEFARHDAVASRVLNVEDITTNEQICHRGDIVSVDGEKTKVIGPIPHLSATPGALRWLGRPPGADSRSILHDLGFTKERITALCEAGHVSVKDGEGTP